MKSFMCLMAAAVLSLCLFSGCGESKEAIAPQKVEPVPKGTEAAAGSVQAPDEPDN